MATTGGGHKSAAGAIAEALLARYDTGVVVEVVDILKEYAPQPLDRADEFYQLMIKIPAAWHGFYDISAAVGRSKIIDSGLSLYARRGTNDFLENHPADVIISTYGFANSAIFNAMSRHRMRIPFITVMTDLITGSALWFDQRTTLFLTPTPEAAELAQDSGMPENKIRVVGMPVSSRFKPPAAPKSELKIALGWPSGRPALLVMAGGEGVGPLAKIAELLSGLKATIVVITGKNTRLFEQLKQSDLPKNVLVQGFAENMPELMQAADLVITKAGAATVMEALNSHLPLVLYAKLSGQEDGNVDFVTQNGAGVWQPHLADLPGTIHTLLDDPDTLKGMTAAAAGIAQPGAATTVARIVEDYLR
jgi:1,2-diacylglycerol 3-beta-galactosyltransferase